MSKLNIKFSYLNLGSLHQDYICKCHPSCINNGHNLVSRNIFELIQNCLVITWSQVNQILSNREELGRTDVLSTSTSTSTIGTWSIVTGCFRMFRTLVDSCRGLQVAGAVCHSSNTRAVCRGFQPVMYAAARTSWYTGVVPQQDFSRHNYIRRATCYILNNTC